MEGSDAAVAVHPGRVSRSLWLDYLRASITVLVVAHHSCLAYTTFASFDRQHYLNSTAPIVDRVRWAFFDYAENFNDVFFMSLMFFISGLLVLPAIARHGRLGFLRGRALRLGIVFVAAVALLMPLAYYASYLQTGGGLGLIGYWLSQFPRDGLPPGPPWFIWMLLFFDLLAVLAYPLLRRIVERREAAAARRKDRPIKAFLAIFGVAILVYIPLIARYGEHTWTVFFVPPFYFQSSRFLLYLAWFAAGLLVGARGPDRGLLAPQGRLARAWPLWVALALVAYNLLWFLPGSPLFALLHPSQDARGLTYVLLWLLSSCASCFAFLALYRALANRPAAWMSSLSTSAYTIFVVHYLFVLWLQSFLLPVALPAPAKFALVFGFALGLSWLTALLFRSLRRLLSQ